MNDTHSSTPVFRGLGSNRSARVRRFSEIPESASADSSSVLSVTGDEFPVTDVVIPASLVDTSSWGRPSPAGASAFVASLATFFFVSTLVHPSSSSAGGFGVADFLGLRAADDSGAVADDSDCASTGTGLAFLAFFFFFGLLAAAGLSAESEGASKPPGTTGGKDTTLGSAGTSSFELAPAPALALAPVPAFFFCFCFLEDDDAEEDAVDGPWGTGVGFLSWAYPYAAAPATTRVATGM